MVQFLLFRMSNLYTTSARLTTTHFTSKLEISVQLIPTLLCYLCRKIFVFTLDVAVALGW
jgi:hypothetical protein